MCVVRVGLVCVCGEGGPGVCVWLGWAWCVCVVRVGLVCVCG